MLTALIMAGGSGERFWPLSTASKPKQLLNIFSEKSMIRETVDRILSIVTVDKIFIATNILQVEEIKKELPEIPVENIIIEPDFKDTAAAIGYSSLIIEERFKDKFKNIEVVVLASDHLIKNKSEFCEIIKASVEEAYKNSVIVTLGIKPHKAETGYGYIEVNCDKNFEINKIYKIKKFREKPNKEIAEEYLASKKYLWNSGIFIFSIDTIFKNFEVLMEEHNVIFNDLRKEIKKNKIGVELSNLVKPYFQKFEKISIDFGIMEHSKNIRVIPVDIGWNDIGSFNALEEIFESDENKNIINKTTVISEDSFNNIIIANGSIISLLGVKNLIVVKNGKNILIAHKEKAQDIKKIVSKYNDFIKESKEKF